MMTNIEYHHLKAACVKANNETAMFHLDKLWRTELERREWQKERRSTRKAERLYGYNDYEY